ncbi:MAG TPA: hypothetical protein VJK72_03375 [Candidatus Nanoarchaeia archaeon]|nr:hypothetical protein [Candidatus Nanoarchaeia archaeon]
MVTAQELGYKAGEMDVRENDTYCNLRPQFSSILGPQDILKKQYEELDALPKNKKWKKKDIGPWNSNYFGTSMGIAGTADKLVLNSNSPALAAITSETPLLEHGILLQTVPENALRFPRSEYGRYANRKLKESEVPQNKFWLATVRNDSELLGRLAELKFKVMRDVYKRNEAMGIYFPKDARLIERALVLGRTYDRADAFGDGSLDNFRVRLVGVRANVKDSSLDELLKLGYCRSHPRKK